MEHKKGGKVSDRKAKRQMKRNLKSAVKKGEKRNEALQKAREASVGEAKMAMGGKMPKMMPGGGKMPKYMAGGKVYKTGGSLISALAKNPKMRAQMKRELGM